MNTYPLDDILKEIWNEKANNQYLVENFKDPWFWNVPEKICRGIYDGNN